MAAKLSSEQRQLLQNARVIDVEDDQTQQVYVILQKDVYIQLIGGDPGPPSTQAVADSYESQQHALAPIWQDVELNEYTDQDGSPLR